MIKLELTKWQLVIALVVIVAVPAIIGNIAMTCNLNLNVSTAKPDKIYVDLEPDESIFDAYVEDKCLNLKIWKREGMSRLAHRRLFSGNMDVILRRNGAPIEVATPGVVLKKE